MADLDTIIGEVNALSKQDQRRLLLLLQDRLLHRADGTLPPPATRFHTLDNALSGIVGVDTITVRCQRRTVSWARHLAAYQMRTEGYTLCEIARCLNRDHTTVIFSLKQVDAMMAMPKQYPQEWWLLRKMREKGGLAV